MLILGLLGAFIFYVAIYLLWEASSTRLDSMEAWMRALTAMIWMPENLVFVILRGLILVVAFYVFADWIVSGVRSAKRRAAKRKEDAEELTLRVKHPPVV